MTFVCATLDDRADATGFDCGVPALTQWLAAHARTAQAKRIAQVYVWIRDGENAALAYFTLSAHEVVASDLSRRLARGLPDRIPSVLLGKLALHTSLHGHGLGGQLLYDVYRRVLSATMSVAARYIVVDAIDESAARFYEHYGFVRAAGDPSLRLVRKISDVEADIA